MNDPYALGLTATLVTLTMTLGVFALYAHTIMPGLKKVADPTFVRAFQAIDRAIINPIFMAQFFVPVFLLGGLLWWALGAHMQDAGALAAAFVLYVIAVGLTVGINVPLNDAIKKVDPHADEPTLAQARRAFNEPRWVAANIVRTLATLGAVVCVAAATLN